MIDDEDRRVVEFLSAAARIEYSRQPEKGKYRVSLVAKGINGGADSLWLRIDDGERLAYHLPIGKYGDSSSTREKNAPGPEVNIGARGLHKPSVTLRERAGVCFDRLILTSPAGQSFTVEAEDMVKDQIEIVDESEQHFFIVNADGATLTGRESFDYGHGGAAGYYSRYPYADAVTTTLVQTEHARLARGDVLTFTNLSYVRGGADFPRRDLRPLDETTWLVTGGEEAVVGLSAPPGAAFRGGEDPFLWIGGRSLVGSRAGDGGDLDAASRARIRALTVAARRRPRPVRGVLPATVRPELEVKPAWRADPGGEVSALAAGSEGILCGTKEGEAVLLSPSGKVWTR